MILRVSLNPLSIDYLGDPLKVGIEGDQLHVVMKTDLDDQQVDRRRKETFIDAFLAKHSRSAPK